MDLSQTHLESLAISGSVDFVLEFLRYAINSILCHRGVYPVEEFNAEKRYGLDLLLIQNPSVEDYLEIALRRARDWLLDGSLAQLVVVLLDADDGSPVERWVFKPKLVSRSDAAGKTRFEVEMNAALKDIVTPTFLPPIERTTVFNILFYKKMSDETSMDDLSLDGWEVTHQHPIQEGDQDTLKPMQSAMHSVGVSVAYRED